MTKVNFDPSVFSAMQTGKPYKSYKKTIMAKAYVTILSQFSGEPEGVILSGDGDTSYIDVWSEMEDMFFRRMNKAHLADGTVIPFTRVEEVLEPTPEQYSDEKLIEIINAPFLKLKSVLNKTTSLPLVARLLNLAKENEASNKFVTAIEARMAELQLTQ